MNAESMVVVITNALGASIHELVGSFTLPPIRGQVWPRCAPRLSLAERERVAEAVRRKRRDARVKARKAQRQARRITRRAR